jgi:hypothetical protein
LFIQVTLCFDGAAAEQLIPTLATGNQLQLREARGGKQGDVLFASDMGKQGDVLFASDIIVKNNRCLKSGKRSKRTL